MDYSKLSDQELDQLVLQKMKPQKAPQQIDYNSLSDEQLDQMVLEKMVAQPPVEKRPIEAATQSFGQAATFGYLPQLQAITAKLLPNPTEEADKLLEAQGISVEEPSYTELRDAYIQDLQELQKENPEMATAGSLAGAITTGFGMGAITKAPKAVGVLRRLYEGAKTGAAYGAIQNPGDVEGQVDPFQLQERKEGAIKGAVLGVGTQGMLEGGKALASTLKAAPQVLKNFAEIKAFKSSGAMLKDFRKAFGNKKTQKLGRTMIDRQIVSAGDDVADIAAKSRLQQSAVGKEIGEIYDQADDILSSLKGTLTEKGQQVAYKLDDEALKLLEQTRLDGPKLVEQFSRYIREGMRGKAGSTEIIKKVEKELKHLAELGDDMSLKDLKGFRQSIDDMINWAKENKQIKGVQEQFMKVRTVLQEVAKRRVATADKIANSKMAEQLTKANKDYSNLAEITKIAEDRVARDNANAAFGLRERLTSGASAVVGGMVGGVPGAVVGGVLGGLTTKAMRNYGTPIVVKMADKAARILEKDPALLGKFAEPLMKAATQGGKDYVRAVSLFMNDPEFKQAIPKTQLNINKKKEKRLNLSR